MKKRNNILLVAVSFLIVLSAVGVVIYKGNDAAGANEKSENLIVLIGDGMGPPQITLSRLYAQEYNDLDQLKIDDYLVGTNSTHADNSPESNESGLVTDSAASGTAFATGNKTYNGAVSVTNEEVAKPVGSVLEAAKAAGKGTGLISTARITHATPAVYASHVRSRDNEDAIAQQYLDAEIDVLIGGGERHFVSSEKDATFGEAAREDELNLVEDFKGNGYAIAHNKEELLQVEGDRVLGLLADTHVPYNLDREGDTIPSLKEQLETAISVLEKNEEGFVIMLEGGRIDHAGHANDIHSIVQEMLEFDEAFAAAVEYAEKDGDTSVIATADHETGGLTIGRDNIYDAYLDVFEPVTASSEKIGLELADAKSEADIKDIVKEYTGIDDLSEDEVELIMSGNLLDGEPSSYEREGSFNAMMAKRSAIGWTGHGHTGVDVGVYGYGPAAELLQGFNDNTDFAKAGAQALGLDMDKVSETLQESYVYPKYLMTESDTYLFPVDALSETFNFEVEKEQDAFTINGNNVEVTVKNDVEKVEIDGTAYEVQIDQDQLYIPIELIDSLAKEKLTWDELSERIVIE